MAKTTRESKLKELVMKELKKTDGFFFKIWGSQNQKAGLPDIIGIYKGKFVGIELKDPLNGSVSKLQQHTIDQINMYGGIAWVVRDLTELRTLLYFIEDIHEA